MGLNNCANHLFYLFLNNVMYIIHVLLNITKISGVLYIHIQIRSEVDFITDSQCGIWFASRLRNISRLKNRLPKWNLKDDFQF